MLKRFVLLLTVVPFAVSCDKTPKQPEVKVYDVVSFLQSADTLVGKEVVLAGSVLHVCQETGTKCFIKADNSDITVRVNAGEEIKEFDKNIVDKKIQVVGIVKEQRVEETQITAKEEAIKEKLEKGTEEEKGHCGTEQANVDNMRQWMKDHNKDYYATYVIESKEYKVLEEPATQK